MLGEMESLWTPQSEEMGENRVRQWAGSGFCMNQSEIYEYSHHT